jgi:hypothetical protein
VLEIVLRRRESNCKRLGCVEPNSSSSWHTGLSGGAPDSVRCARLVRVNSLLSGFDGGVRLKITGPSGGAPDCLVSHPRRTHRSREKHQGNVAIIHRTGEPTVASANGRPQNLWATLGSSNGRQGAPDCPVCMELTCLAGLYHLNCILESGWPVEGVPEGLTDQRAG